MSDLKERIDRELEAVRHDINLLLKSKRTAFVANSLTKISKHQGVYVIRCAEGNVLHVGRTNKASLQARLKSHARNGSSFVRLNFQNQTKAKYEEGELIKRGCTFQYLEISNNSNERAAYRRRAFLEAFATVVLQPEHCGVYPN